MGEVGEVGEVGGPLVSSTPYGSLVTPIKSSRKVVRSSLSSSSLSAREEDVKSCTVNIHPLIKMANGTYRVNPDDVVEKRQRRETRVIGLPSALSIYGINPCGYTLL